MIVFLFSWILVALGSHQRRDSDWQGLSVFPSGCADRSYPLQVFGWSHMIFCFWVYRQWAAFHRIIGAVYVMGGEGLESKWVQWHETPSGRGPWLNAAPFRHHDGGWGFVTNSAQVGRGAHGPTKHISHVHISRRALHPPNHSPLPLLSVFILIFNCCFNPLYCFQRIYTGWGWGKCLLWH